MDGDSLEVRRSVLWREWQVYVAALLYTLSGAAVLWFGGGLTVDLWATASEGSVTALVLLGLVASAALAIAVNLLLLAMAPWQLVLRHGSRDDIVFEVDDRGVVLVDAGYRVTLPWACIIRFEVIERGEGWYRIRLAAADGFESTRDPVARFVSRQLRRDGMTLRFTDSDPTEAELLAALSEHSGGRFPLPSRAQPE